MQALLSLPCLMHAAIIGAGPAGCAAAITLASRGWRTTLIERAEFPRVKVCGEFISPAATEVLESLLPPVDLRTAGARTVDDLVLEHGDQQRSWWMPRGAWVLSRRALDDLLLARARAGGARVVQPARVRGVEYGEAGVRVRLEGAGAAERVEADVVVHADGSGRHDAPPARAVPGRAGVVGLKCHVTAPGGVRGLRMRCAPGAYIGLVQVEGAEATCALVARSTLVRAHGGDIDAMLSAIWPAFDGARRTTPWLSCPVQSAGFTPPGHPRSFRAGNAAAAVEPVGGEGIGLALWSGVTLGTHLGGMGVVTPESLRRAQREYARAYRARLRTRRAACRAAAEVLMRPHLMGALWPLLGVPSLTIRPWYRLTGKAA